MRAVSSESRPGSLEHGPAAVNIRSDSPRPRHSQAAESAPLVGRESAGLGRERPGEAVFGSKQAALGPCGWPLPGARVGSLRPAFTPEPSGNDFPIFLQPVAWDLSLPSLAGLVFFQRGLTSVLSPTPSGISPAPRSPGRLPAPLRALLCESGTQLVQSGVPRWGAGGQR